MTTTKPEILYLEIAEVRIKILLHKTEWLQMRSTLKKAIIDCYTHCVIPATKHDWTVEIFDARRVEVVKTKKSPFYYSFLYSHHTVGHIITSYHLSIFQFQALLGELVRKTIIKRQGLIIHASAIAIKDKNAYIFIGESDQGKSTILRKLMKYDTQGLCDDSVVMLKKGSKYFIYQTPFPERLWNTPKTKKSYELKGAFFLKKSTKCEINILTKAEMLARIIPECWWEESGQVANIRQIIGFVSDFKSLYELTSHKKAGRQILDLITSATETH